MKHTLAFFSFIALTLSTSVPTEASDYSNEAVRANSLYVEKKYAASAQAYESLIEKRVQNGYLYYNLGNTYIRMGKTGPAILNYIRAQKWIPRDENLEANLKFAIQQTRDKIELPPPGTLNVLFFWVNDLNFNELIAFTIGLNFIFWISLTLWMYFRTPTLKIACNTLLCFLLLSFVSIGVKIKNESDLRLGVVLAKDVKVKSGRAEDAVTLFQLHEGTLVTITDKHDNWLEVRLNDEQKGWVPKGSLGT